MLICNVVGARPNFMKIAPIVLELERRGIAHFLVHTEQHYDPEMSQAFFEDLELPQPDIRLGAGPATQGRQIARILIAFEELFEERRPDLVVVAGDVTSTLAAALAAAKRQIPVAHVEAGLRSFDRSMPEEVNRIVTDHLSELLLATEESGRENLLREGVDPGKIYLVGNCMVDTLWRHVAEAMRRSPWERFGLSPGGYALLTLHRPSNVDDPKTFCLLMTVMQEISSWLPVLFPVHPRTLARMGALKKGAERSLVLCEPLSYLTFIGLLAKARCVLTDSGGVQEEATALQIPCLTLRWNTERPVTIDLGTNRLVGTDPVRLRQGVEDILAERCPRGESPPLWDGQAAGRIVDVIQSWRKSRRGGSSPPVFPVRPQAGARA